MERLPSLWIISGIKSERTLNTNKKKFKIRHITSNTSSQFSRNLTLIILHYKSSLANTFIMVFDRQLNFELTIKVKSTWLK